MKSFTTALAIVSIPGCILASTGIGTRAPSLKVAAYVKGARVDLAHGTHVVEFWATWCGPCKVTIPELSNLAKKFRGKVDFTGVSVNEQGDDPLGQVKHFVHEMGSSMAYNVAIDTDSKYMYSKWMEPVGMTSLPTAFVVKNGVVVWIGLPNLGLGAALKRIVAGKYTVSRSRADFSDTKSMIAAMESDQSALQEEMQKFVAARQGGDCDAALKVLNGFITTHPKLKPLLMPYRAEIMLIQGKPAGYALARSIVDSDRYGDSADVFATLAWAIVEPTPPAKNPDYGFALKLAKRAVELTDSTDATILDTLAIAYSKTGNNPEAIVAESKAVGLLRVEGDPATLKEYSERLEHFRGAKTSAR